MAYNEWWFYLDFATDEEFINPRALDVPLRPL
jgi:hypothetical protein